MVLQSTLLVGGLQLGLRSRRGNLTASPLVSVTCKTSQSWRKPRTYPQDIVKLSFLDHCDLCLEEKNFGREKLGDEEKPRENKEESRTFRRDETEQSDPRKPYTGVWNRLKQRGHKTKECREVLEKEGGVEETRGEESRRREGDK